ncbi:MAG: hypothetical protein ACRC7O_19020 [Fimbriiglobus sp.]
MPEEIRRTIKRVVSQEAVFTALAQHFPDAKSISHEGDTLVIHGYEPSYCRWGGARVRVEPRGDRVLLVATVSNWRTLMFWFMVALGTWVLCVGGVIPFFQYASAQKRLLQTIGQRMNEVADELG